MKDIGKKGVSAVKWGAVSTVARFGLQMVAQVLLARILGPEVYGLFGLGLLVYTFCIFMANIGLGWSLMHKVQLADEDIRFAVTWQTLMGLIGTVGLYCGAALIADYFHEPRVQGVIEAMSFACVLAAATSPTNNLLQRHLNFRAVGLIQVGSYAAGYLCVGLPVALLTHSVYALVAAWLTQISVTLAASYWVQPHPVKPLFWYPNARSMLTRGGLVFGTNVCNWVLNNLDRIMVGRLLNTHSVGVYTAGFNMANMPNTLLLGALQPAFLSAGARMQEDRPRLRQAYLQVISAVLVLITPLFALLAFLSPHIIGLLYGAKWVESGPVLTLLFAAMPAYVAWGLSTPILWNTDRSWQEAALQLPVLVIAVALFYLFAASSVVNAAAVAAAVLALRGLVVVTAAGQALQLGWTDFFPQVWRAAVWSAVVIAGAWTGDQLLKAAPGLAGPWLHATALTLDSVGSAAAVLAAWLLRPGLLGEPARKVLERFVPRLKTKVGPAVAPERLEGSA